uniref:SH3 domain-containing protein n=1 Tax=Plectus sambesii TaxID=2011161 RepID=A0A914VWH4_9BILA
MTSTDGYFGRAEYDFAEALQNELPLSVGDVVFVTQSVDSNWSEGILVKTGTKGHFPASFVSPLAMPAKKEPNESVVVAIGDFKTPERGDLHFEKGAVIVVSRVIDDNWMEGGLIGPNGRLTGTKGIFPKSFVVDVNEFSSSWRNESAKGGGEVRRVEARVIADLQAKLDDEIDLKKNEIVSVLDSSTEWCTVQTSDGRRGTCPKPFLSFETKQSASATLHQPSAPVASATPQKATVPQYACDSLEPYGRTKFQFHAEYTGELSFAAGCIVKLLRYVDDEWLEGELDGKTGIFPVSYVDIIIDCPPSMGLSADSGYTSAREPSITSTAASSCSSTATNVSEERVALFDFAGGERDDLPVRTGDIVQVVEIVNAEWVKCRHSTTGRVGLIPANFLCHRDAGTSSQDVAINWRVPPATAEMTSSAFRFSGEVPLSVSGYNRGSTVRWHAPHSIDSPIAFSSSRAASPMLQPIIIPADEFVERQHQQAQQNASQQKAAPPPRPAMQPSRLSSSTLEKEKEVKEVERGERMKLAREKIAQDLVKSEMQFVTDLRACDSALRADPADLLDKTVLLAGFPEVIDLASKLLNALQAEYGNSDADRAFGSLFLRFQADFSKVYGKYWETSDAAAV